MPVTISIVNGFDEAQIALNGFQAKQMFDADFRGPSAPEAPEFIAEALDHGGHIRWKSNAEASVIGILHSYERRHSAADGFGIETIFPV